MTYFDQQAIYDIEDLSQLYEYDPVDYYDHHDTGDHTEDAQTEESVGDLALISNDDFLAAIFGTEFDDERPLVCRKYGDPDQGGWFAKTWPCDTKDENQNWYFLPGLYAPDKAGEYRAKKELAAQIFAVVVDDVGTKVCKERFDACPPSWAIETSPNNFQYGFILINPVIDVDAIEQLKTDLIAAGLCDPGARGAMARWSRLPVAINGRPKYGNPSPRCRLVVWCPDLKYSSDDLYSKLSLGVKPAAKPSIIGHPPSTLTQVSAMAAEAEIVIERLKAVGLYKASLGSGKHDITCPWVEQHTDEVDNGTAYFEPTEQFPTGGFKCHHSHGHLFSISSLKEFLNLETKEIQTVPIRLPQKLPVALRPVPQLDVNWLPDSLKDAVVDLSDRLQCPADYLAVEMLSSAGTVVGNRVGIFPYENDESWEVYPALWGGIVGDPGSKKTPSLQAAHRPIAHLENSAAQKYAQEMQVYETTLTQYEDDLANWKKSKVKGAKPLAPTAPKRERYIVHDTTYQALGAILADNPRGVMALADELSGLLQSLDTAGQEAARGFYLSGWSGNGSYSFDRIGRGSITLPRFCLSVFGGFQPDRIKAYVQQSQRGSSKNDGLIQRFQLLVWPDPVPNPAFIDRRPDQAALLKYHQAVVAVPGRVDAGIGGAKRLPNGSQILHFSGQAQKLFNSWFVANEMMLTDKKLDAARISHFAKYRSLVPALALLFHLLDGYEDSVSEDALRRAISYANYLKAHANRVYGSVSGHDLEAVRLLATRLLEGSLLDGFSCRTLMLRGWSGLATKEQVQNALDALVEYGWLIEVETKTGGRPSVRYYLAEGVSPDLL